MLYNGDIVTTKYPKHTFLIMKELQCATRLVQDENVDESANVNGEERVAQVGEMGIG